MKYLMTDFDMGNGHTLRAAVTPLGEYIGDESFAKMLQEWGIEPQCIGPDSSVCQIGYREAEQKWFGWSHRGMCGFEVGYVVKVGDLAESDITPVGFTAMTLDDAKALAISFAKNVA